MADTNQPENTDEVDPLIDDPFGDVGEGELHAPDATDEELQAEFVDFFGALDAEPAIEDEATAEETEGEGDVTPPAQGDPATAPVETPAVETPAPVEQIDQIPAEDDVPRDEYGMPAITQEDWDAYLENDDIPLAERLKEYSDFNIERNRRKAVVEDQRKQYRVTEVESTRGVIKEAFGAASEEITTEVEGRVAAIMAHLTPEQRMIPGFHQLAANLVIAEGLPSYLKRAGLTSAPIEEATPAKVADTPRVKSGARVVAVETGAGGTGTRIANGSAAAAQQLTADQRAAAKEFGMTPQEYLEFSK